MLSANTINIHIHNIHLAHQEPTNLWIFFQQPFFSSVTSVMKKTLFLRKYVSLLGKKTTFSHTWCHDILWFIPLNDSNPFIETSLGSIPLSTLHVDYTFTPLALAGSSHKKGPDALGTCRTTLSVITVNLESLDIHSDFLTTSSPTEGKVRSIGGNCSRWRMRASCLITLASASIARSVWQISQVVSMKLLHVMRRNLIQVHPIWTNL